jgi:hypothetical protein
MTEFLTLLFSGVTTPYGVIVCLILMIAGLLWLNNQRDTKRDSSIGDLTDKINELITSNKELTTNTQNLLNIFMNSIKIK